MNNLKEQIDYSHHPILNEKSIKLDNINQQKYQLDVSKNDTVNIITKSSKFDDRVLIMLQKQAQIQQEVELQRIQKQKQVQINNLKEDKELTFQPKINKNNDIHIQNQSLSFIERNYTIEPYIKKEQAKLQKEEELEQKQLEQCTFTPQINSETQNILQFNNPHGYDEAVNRLRFAQQQTRIKKQALNHIPTGENYEKIRNNKNLQPFSFVDLQRKFGKGQPILQIEVKLGLGKISKITIYKGDTAEMVTKEFAKTHSLSKQKQENLFQIVLDQMQKLNDE